MTNREIQTIRVNHHGELIHLGLIRQGIDKYNSFVGSLRTVDELNKTYGTSARLIRPEVADDLLTRGKYLRLLEEYSPFAVGAIVAHEGRVSGSYRSKPFSDEVRYYDSYDIAKTVSQDVNMATGRFKGETNSALIVINPALDDLTIEVKDENYKRSPQCYVILVNIKIDIPEDRIRRVNNFPSNCGWYQSDNDLAIPTGREVEESGDARYLARFQKPVHHSGSLAWDPVIHYSGTYVGLIFRSALPEEDFYPAGKGVVMAPVDSKGIIVEIPDEDLEKLVERSTWKKFVDFLSD